MSMDTVEPAQVGATIYAGTTFRKGWSRYIGESQTPDDYTDCTAVAELRDATSKALLATFSTAVGADGAINFAGPRLELYMSHIATKALPAFESAICHVEVRRPWGDVERLYEIAFSLSAEVTLVDPPTP